jgi:hypothetical protein
MASLHWSMMREAWSESPGRAYLANVRAVEAFPAEQRSRVQLFRSFAYAYRAGEATWNPEGAKALYRISASAAPYDEGLKLSWRGFLITAKRRGELQ